MALDRQGKEISLLTHFDFLNAQAKVGVKKNLLSDWWSVRAFPEILRQPDKVLSLSLMTLTHEMSALFLMEQFTAILILWPNLP